MSRGLGALLLAALVAAGGPEGPPLRTSNSQLVTRDAFLMGTRVHLAAYATTRDEGLARLDAALRALERTEQQLSTWRQDSDISALNRQPVGRPWQATRSTCRVLRDVFAWQAKTGGVFDPGIGRLIEAWDIHGDGRVPSPAEVTAATARSGLSRMFFDETRCEVTRRADATIDVGAFGKGEALDRVEAALGPGSWLVDLGGQVSVGGARPDGQSWTVGVAHPQKRDQSYLQISLHEGSLSTSGGSERDLVVKGKRIAHHLDPRTGMPAAFAGAVTVWHRSGLAADALTTALYVMGPEEGMSWAEAHGIAAVFLVPDGDTVRMLTTTAWSRHAGASAPASLSDRDQRDLAPVRLGGRVRLDRDLRRRALGHGHERAAGG
ncbi:MAG TPA: FAD:protein FMN transferase [Vicinamibacterales bacterium]